VRVNVGLLRWVDAWVGVPLCACLTVLDRARRLLRPPSAVVTSPRSILIVKLAEQGATVVAVPALRRAAEMVGRENLHFCLFDENRDILDVLDIIPPENVHVLRTRSPFLLAGDILSLVRKLDVDTVVNFEFFARGAAILCWLVSAQTRVGLHRFGSGEPYTGDLMTHRVRHNPQSHTADVYDWLVRVSAFPPGDHLTPDGGDACGQALPGFTPASDERDRMQTFLRDAVGWMPGMPLVILNPNAGDMMPLRKWPLENYAELARRILERSPETRVVVTGLPKEVAGARALCASLDSDRIASLAGRTSIRDLFTLYTFATALVTNDSGPAHFASLTRIAVVVLFGPETPQVFRPLGPNIQVLWAGLDCSPCVSAFNHRKSTCLDNRCMRAITVDHVWDALGTISGLNLPVADSDKGIGQRAH
jgi:ADP-heptose:LPS heptosyltransferase